MSWTNWIYLGVGLGLGISTNWLLRQSDREQSEKKTRQQTEQDNSQAGDKPPTETDKMPVKDNELIQPPQADNQDVLALLAQLKQTQLAYYLAEEMSQFKAGFLARTSHELRSPLNSLIGLHQLILSDLCDHPAEEREFVALAHESALKLMQLMDEILEVAKIAHGSKKLEIQPLQLTEILQQVYQLLHLVAANHRLPFHLLPADPEIYVLADPHWLLQVLVNLLDVSIAQMQEGSISISAQVKLATESVQIWLDVQLPASTWSKFADLSQLNHIPQQPIYKNAALSPGMKLLLHQTLLEAMQGSIEILSVPTASAANFTRIQVTIPLVIPETGFLEPEEN